MQQIKFKQQTQEVLLRTPVRFLPVYFLHPLKQNPASQKRFENVFYTFLGWFFNSAGTTFIKRSCENNMAFNFHVVNTETLKQFLFLFRDYCYRNYSKLVHINT